MNKKLSPITVFQGKEIVKSDRYGWEIRGNPGKLEWVPKSHLMVSDEYQREVNDAKMKSITASFDWALFGVLSVAKRDDGSLFVTDGQHRLFAALRHQGVDKVPCYITQVDTMSEEAKMFLGLNTLRKPVSALDKFRAMSVAEDGEAAFVKDFVETLGLKIGERKGGGKPGEVICIAAMLRVSGDDRETFMTVMRVANRCFREKGCISAIVVTGLAYLYKHLDGGIDSKRFIDRLDMFTPEDIHLATRKAQAFHGISGPRVNAEGILSIMNKGLKVRFELKASEGA